jgi:hypothetical protein
MSSHIKWYASWRKKAASALLALVLSGVGVLALAGPAAAAPSDCRLGLHCTYSGYNYGNDAWQQPSTHKFESCVDNMYIGWRSYKNVASSAFNNGRTDRSYLYTGAFQTGTRIPFERGMGTPNLGTRNFNDTAESGYFESNLSRARSILCR